MLKRSTFLAALMGAVVFSSSLIAGEVTKADRDALVAHLKKTEAAFLKSIDGVSDAQWTWKAAPDRWSVAETAEHITKAEDLLRGMVEGMLKAPAHARAPGQDQGQGRDHPEGDSGSQPRRHRRRSRWCRRASFASKAALIEAFKAARAKTLAIAGGTTDLRAYAKPACRSARWTPTRRILFLSAHTERHTKQIEEVKATAGYPAK